MNTTQSANSFSLPADAATRILCEPKNRTTGKLRRRAWAARTKTLSSFLPVEAYPPGATIFGERRSRVPARLAKLKKEPKRTLGRATSGEDKLKRKLKGRAFKQLLIWEKRLSRQIRNLSKMADKLEGNLKESQLAEQLRARIAQLHTVGGLLQAEIDARG